MGKYALLLIPLWACSSGNTAKHAVGACDNLGAAGMWQSVAPPQLNPAGWCTPGSMGCPGSGQTSTYGAHFFALDPSTSGTIYLGTDGLGLWKSTDCGASWVKIDTGANGDMLDQGRGWTIAIDPTDTQVIYTVAGYGPSGVFKSVNGGVDWQQMLTPDIQPSIPYGGFIEKITLDPTNHQHLVVSFHDKCTNSPSGGGEWGCLAESPDGGMSWTLTNSAAEWGEGDGQTLLDGKTWLFGNGAGIYRTTNGGGSWTQVYTGGASGGVYTAKDGSYYVAGSFTTLHSTGGVTWTELKNSHGGASVNGSTPITSDGTTLYSAQGAYGGSEPMGGWYWSAPLSDPTTWTNVGNAVPLGFGGSNLAYDADHHLLYSSNLTSGFWRIVLP
jgi:photosystem II stability/assembly factor-like uncharacterized protein